MASMDPYLPCWCLSGKKWKWCHKDREKQARLPIGALMSKQRAELQVGYCSHPLADPSICSDRIVRAHTVQRNGGLSKIEEGGHVLSAKAGAEGIFENTGSIVPKLAGVRSATTFNGFCQTHDSSMFRPVEVENRRLSQENAFLLSFRALAYETYTKRAALRCISIQREMDRGSPFELQVMIQQHLNLYMHGLHRGLDDLARWKASYDSTLLSGDYSEYSFFAVEFSDVIPIVACGAFHPEIDFDGNQLQVISRGDAPFDHIAFNLAPLDGGTVAVFGWTATGADAARQFVESFKRIPDDQKANAAVHLAFEHLENTCIRPSWWNNLSDEKRAFVVRKLKSGTGDPAAERSSQSLEHSQINFVSARVIETLEA